MRDIDGAVAVLAARQHGLVTVEQLLPCGMDRRAISRRVAAGRLHRVHRGVYAVGHPGLTVEARYLAAVLACGTGAVLSHGAAAHLLGLVRGAAPAPEVTSARHRRPADIVFYRARRLHDLDTSVLGVIPITTVPRTLLDLAGRLAADELARACHEAHVRHRTTPAQVEAAIARTPSRPGVRVLRQILVGDTHVTLSRAEGRFLKLLRAARLPLPETNRVVNGDRVDCRWPAHRLVVELDSYRFHATRHAFEEDLRRAARARAAGDTHLRFAWGDLYERPGPMLAELARLLGRPPVRHRSTRVPPAGTSVDHQRVVGS